MIADKFVAGLGVLQVDLEKTPELRELIVGKMKVFLRLGGSVAWDDLATMDEQTLGMFLEAAASLQAEREESIANRVLARVTSAIDEAMKEPQP